jgi:hypothetical protein
MRLDLIDDGRLSGPVVRLRVLGVLASSAGRQYLPPWASMSSVGLIGFCAAPGA